MPADYAYEALQRMRDLPNPVPTPSNFHVKQDGNEEVRLTSETGAQKGSKLDRFDLIPTEPLRLLAHHYGVGARKYAENNWRKGYKWSLSYAAMQRHANAFWSGEDIDEETGTPHIIAAAWHCFAMAQYMIDFKEYDDRPSKPETDSSGGDQPPTEGQGPLPGGPPVPVWLPYQPSQT